MESTVETPCQSTWTPTSPCMHLVCLSAFNLLEAGSQRYIITFTGQPPQQAASTTLTHVEIVSTMAFYHAQPMGGAWDTYVHLLHRLASVASTVETQRLGLLAP